MDFYKEGKVFGITGGQRLDMSGATFNHKGLILLSPDTASLQSLSLKFGSIGGKSSSVDNIAINSSSTIGSGDMTTANFANAIIPARVLEIKGNASSGTITVVLLN